jgi:hypothetical protein
VRTIPTVLVDLALVGLLVWTHTGLFDPGLAFTETHVAGGDMISHPWIAKSLKLAWSQGHFWSWNHGWFAGFPFLYFYFYPLYALTLGLDVVGFSEPVAFKVAVLCVALAVPLVYYASGRRWLSPPLAFLFASLGIALFFDESYSWWGGNFKSLLAGQASHELGLLATVALFPYLLRGETSRPGAVICYALAILGHIYSALFSTLLVGLLLGLGLLRDRSPARLWQSLKGPLLSVLLTSFWWLPFLYYRRYTVAPTNTTVVDWREVLRVLQVESSLYAFLYAGAAAALAAGLLRGRRDAPALALAALAVATAASLFFLEGTPFLHVRFPSAIYLFTLLAFLCALRRLDVHPALQWAALGPLAVVVLQSVVPSAALDATLPAALRHPAKDAAPWWSWNLSGIETKPDADHVLEVWRYLEELQDDEGRVAVEYHDYNSYGSPRIFELTPYMSGKPVLEGLLLESSTNYPSAYYIGFHFNRATWWPGFPVVVPETDVRKGIGYLARYNVKYFVASREPTRRAMHEIGYPLLLANPGFEIFAVNPESRVASVLQGPIPVVRAPQPVLATVLHFPESLEKIVEILPGLPGPGESVKDVDAGQQTLEPLAGRWSEDGQSYTIPETGAAPGRARNILLKVSYFPNWRTDGGESVRLVTPNLMLVRTERPSLRVTYRAGWAERIALLVSAASLIVLLGGSVRKHFAPG